MMLSVYT